MGKTINFKRNYKGLSLSITAVVAVLLAAIVLAYLTMFFLTSTGGQLSRAEAEQVYTSGCLDFCGVTQDTFENGYIINYEKSEQATKFREACITLGYINKAPSSPNENARGVLTCLATCGNCYIDEGETDQYRDNIGNIANNGLNNP